MDKVVAARLEGELLGQDIGGWRLSGCIGYGKSAIVFQAERDNREAAVKVFDRELVERFGRDAQRARVLREKSLVGRHHENLIDILDAGEDEARELFFVAMARFRGRNLASALRELPHERVSDLIAQVASAAQFLESLNLAHRDIKPENIGVSEDFSTAVLLDLGVLRPIGFSTVTDQDGQRTFVGTLQYSPPELLLREEQDSLEGWRAVTFYQLGAVLHDLLTRKPLFADDLTPYGHLADAVSRKVVRIDAPGTAPELRMLAQDCLVKDPRRRLELVSWSRFSNRPAAKQDMQAVRDRIERRRMSALRLDGSLVSDTGATAQQALEALQETLVRLLRDACKRSNSPPFTISASGPGAALVRLTFDKSRSHSLTVQFAIYLEGSILDPIDSIARVRIAVATCSRPSEFPAVPPQSELRLIFEGVQVHDILGRKLTDAVLVALDRTQDLCAQNLVGDTLQWFDVQGEA
jgi:serine/threonine protein kinase